MRLSKVPLLGVLLGALVLSLLTLMPVRATAAPSSDSGAAKAGQASLGAKRKPKKPRHKARRHAVHTRPMTISSANFGIHDFTAQRPGLPAGTIRLNCFPSWQSMNPAPGVYHWGGLDATIARVRSWGFKDIIFTLCGTPGWAAKLPLPVPERQPYWHGTDPNNYEYGNAPPKQLAYWTNFVSALAHRYKGRISGYEMWNEATSAFMWQGGPQVMAQMTQSAYRVIKAADPAAKVISANVQTIEQPYWFETFFPPYLRALRAMGWPIDAIAVHTYAGSQVSQRAAILRHINKIIRRVKAPRRIQLWDTETNYLKIPNPSAALQQGLVAHTYLDSWAAGVKRTYWYYWNTEPNSWLSVQTMTGSPAVAAYRTLAGWTVGTRMLGCSTKGTLMLCTFTKGKKRFVIASDTRPTGVSSYRFPTKTKRLKAKARRGLRVCAVNGATCSKVKKRVSVSFLPVRVG